VAASAFPQEYAKEGLTPGSNCWPQVFGKPGQNRSNVLPVCSSSSSTTWRHLAASGAAYIVVTTACRKSLARAGFGSWGAVRLMPISVKPAASGHCTTMVQYTAVASNLHHHGAVLTSGVSQRTTVVQYHGSVKLPSGSRLHGLPRHPSATNTAIHREARTSTADECSWVLPAHKAKAKRVDKRIRAVH
jgi:hypothetical protein